MEAVWLSCLLPYSWGEKNKCLFAIDKAWTSNQWNNCTQAWWTHWCHLEEHEWEVPKRSKHDFPGSGSSEKPGTQTANSSAGRELCSRVLALPAAHSCFYRLTPSEGALGILFYELPESEETPSFLQESVFPVMVTVSSWKMSSFHDLSLPPRKVLVLFTPKSASFPFPPVLVKRLHCTLLLQVMFREHCSRFYFPSSHSQTSNTFLLNAMLWLHLSVPS